MIKKNIERFVNPKTKLEEAWCWLYSWFVPFLGLSSVCVRGFWMLLSFCFLMVRNRITGFFSETHMEYSLEVKRKKQSKMDATVTKWPDQGGPFLLCQVLVFQHLSHYCELWFPWMPRLFPFHWQEVSFLFIPLECLACAQLISRVFAVSHHGVGAMALSRVRAPPVQYPGSWFSYPDIPVAPLPLVYKAMTHEY